MVAIQSLTAVLATAILANAAPSSLSARATHPPGSSVGGARFFAAANPLCDRGGPSDRQASFVVPPASRGTIATGTCQGIVPYGSVALDFLASGCVFEQHANQVCSDPASANSTTPGCYAGASAQANWYRVVCN